MLFENYIYILALEMATVSAHFRSPLASLCVPLVIEEARPGVETCLCCRLLIV